jgi:HK97 family phage major capsid protein
MNTKALREEAGALLKNAQASLDNGNVEEMERQASEAQAKMQKADEIDQAQAKMKAITTSFEGPVQELPIASSDVAKYDSGDKTASISSSHKPATWVKGLPAMAQPRWVQEQMGQNLKDEAQFQTNAFVKWFTSKSDDMFWKTATADEIKAMQEDTDAEGGFFVPEQFINQVIHDPGLPTGLIRPLCTTIRVSSKDGYIPSMGSASWAAIAEEGAYGDQTPTVGQVAFSLEKSGGLIKVTRELLDDSAINLPSLLTTIFQEASGRFEDVGILNGNGTTNYSGILTSAAADVRLASATAIVGADLLNVYYTLEAQHRANASWVMPSLINKDINSIQITGAGITGVTDLTTAPANFILGRPVINNDVTGNGFATSITASDEIAIFGNFKDYYIFDRVGYSIRRNDSLYMENDQVGFFASRRGDGQVGLTDAFKVVKAAAS